MSIDAGSGDTQINGRPIASVELIQSWASEVHGPELPIADAMQIAQRLNYLLWFSVLWLDDYRDYREANEATQRLRRIAKALRQLKADLPGIIQDTQQANADVSLTVRLLELIEAHSAIIDYCPPAKRGRPLSLEGNVSANLEKQLREIWGAAATQKALTGFVQCEMAWLTGRAVPRSDEAISKAIRRRNTRTKRR